MGKKTGYSRESLLGNRLTHYDEKGRKTGYSTKDLLGGGYTDYDAKGRKIGHSTQMLLGGYAHYDNKGKRIGYSEPSWTGGFQHYDDKGRKTMYSERNLTDGFTHRESTGSGCYIATCVYGSYDCPEVRTLRRYRDYRLAATLPGRLFIRAYYALSPAVVRVFGGSRLLRSIWRSLLDPWVKHLQAKGYKDTPYSDRRS